MLSAEMRCYCARRARTREALRGRSPWKGSKKTCANVSTNTVGTVYANLISLGGFASVVGGVAWAAAWAAQWYLEINPGVKGWAFFLLLLGAMATLAALHVLQRERYGVPGTLVALMAFVGLGLMFVYELVALLTGQYLPGFVWVYDVGVWAATVGSWFLGAATIATRVLPWWCGAALMAGGPVLIAVGPILAVYLAPWVGIAWALVGYAVFRAGGRRSAS
jgi:hypothetical protein